MKLEPVISPEISNKRPLIIAGPCSAESEQQVLTTAKELAENGIKVFRAGIWKPRTKPGSFEGVGSIGLEWLKKVKEKTGMLVSTEVATTSHVEEALKHKVDILWIGARTSASPFAMQEIAETLKGVNIPVLIKNPVNPDLDMWVGAIERIYNAGIKKIGAIHRGFSAFDKKFYRNLPHWDIPIELHRQIPELPIICDPSHIGGKRELIASISQQAMDLNFDGLIIETHCNPDEALSDAAQQITPAELKIVLDNLIIRDKKPITKDIESLRKQIDKIDSDLINLLTERIKISNEIGYYKKEHNMPILQEKRYEEILEKNLSKAEELGLNTQFVKKILVAIHEESVKQQMEIRKK